VADNQVITPYPVYPLGIAHLAGALEAAGHRPYQFDLLGHGGLKALARRLSTSPPDLVALSIRNLDTVDSTAPNNFIPKAQETMALIRRFCRAPVVVGGPAFSIMPEAIIELFQADYGVVGEGEIILPWLADCLERGAPPDKRIFRAKPADAPWQPASSGPNRPMHRGNLYGMILQLQTITWVAGACSMCRPSEGVRTGVPIVPIPVLKEIVFDFETLRPWLMT
jgi:lipid biosynthesis B12-binding/radical SAM protein